MVEVRIEEGASLGVSVAAVLAVLAAASASAQDDEIEQIIVTGSRIARPDFASASPIVSIQGDAFERTSANSVEAVVSRLPQFVPSFGSTSNNPANGGQSNVQLRGLGLTSTLVLLDGRRVVPGNGNGVVDVNVIPPALVESVEVISGGASAVYGSDAIAGVVNFKLKHKFEGLQFDGGWSQTERGDGQEYNLGVTAGLSFADGRGDAYGYVGYSNRDDIFQSARRFSEVSLTYLAPGQGSRGPDKGFRPSGSITIPEGRTNPSVRPSAAAHNALFAKYGFASGTVPRTPYSFNADGTLFTAGDGATPNSVVNFRGEQDPNLVNDRLYSYNFGAVNYLQLPLEQLSAFGRATFELTPEAKLYAQVLFSDYTADTALASTPANPLSVPVGNPYVPADLKVLLASRPNPGADFSVRKRLLELGPRISSNQHDVWQGTAGVEGTVFGDWRYDAYVQVGAYDQTDEQSGNALRSKMYELLRAPDGGASVCGGLNLFGLNSISPECAKFIAVDATNRDGFDQTIVEASLSGDLASLPAGNLGIALGAMYKRDEYFYTADPIATVFLPDGSPDIQGFNASDDIEGSDHNTDFYVEALVPLLAGVPGVERLEAGLGYRYSDYASAGGVDAYKAELLYLPVDRVRVRGSYQRAVRAPTVFELYLPQLPAVTGWDPVQDPLSARFDPCTAGSPQRTGPDAAKVAALCIAQGVPASALPDFQDGDGEYIGVAGGNPDLDPETADTVTFGAVVQSWSDNPWLSAMQLSVDWYRIEVDEAIAQVFADQYVPLCFDPRTNPGFDADNYLCGYFSRDPGTGEIDDFKDINRNVVGTKVSGIDTQFDWRFDAGPGEVGINWLISWLDEFETRDYVGLSAEDRVGRAGRDIGSALPEWKWNLNVKYDWGPLSVAAQWRYIDGMRDIEKDYEVDSYDYFDLFASYVFDTGPFSGLTLRGGVENLADQDPPLLATPVQANTDPSQYDVLGRRYYLSLSYRF